MTKEGNKMEIKIKLSMIYFVVFIIALVGMGIASFFYGDITSNGSLQLSLFCVLFIQSFATAAIFEKKMSFMDLSNLPKIEELPKKEESVVIYETIIERIRERVDIPTIIDSLVRSGHSFLVVNQVLNNMIKEGVIMMDGGTDAKTENKGRKAK
jgi:hypothetical protein